MKTSRYRKRLQKSRRLRHSNKKKTKKRRARRKSTRKRRGGSSTRTRTVSTTPTQSYGFDHGSCPRTNATNFQTSQNSAQQSLNSTHGGAKKRRGGSATLQPQTLDVPQFPQKGPAIGPQDANNTSVATNTSAVAGTVNIGDTPSYTNQTFNPATSHKLDKRISGRYLNIKVTMSGATNPKLTTVSFNLKGTGRR